MFQIILQIFKIIRDLELHHLQYHMLTLQINITRPLSIP